jgi:hypothetical protein
MDIARDLVRLMETAPTASRAEICTKPEPCPCSAPCERFKANWLDAMRPALQGNLEAII